MAALALGLAGAAAGSWLGGATGAAIGWTIGAGVGSILFGSNSSQNTTQEGPRLSDLKVTNSSYGNMLPYAYGLIRMSGNLIWSSDIQETKHSDTQDAQQGGKGGQGPTVTTNTYTYAVNSAFAICEGIIAGVRRIWANGTLILDLSTTNFNLTTSASISGGGGSLRIYFGDENQLPDGLIEAYQGAGQVPAFRGIAYVVFENFQLANYGNSIPNFTFEIGKAGVFETAGLRIATGGSFANIVSNPVDGCVYVCDAANGKVSKVDLNTNAVVASVIDSSLVGFEFWTYNPINSKLYANVPSGVYSVDTTTLLTSFAWDGSAFTTRFNGTNFAIANIPDTQQNVLYGSFIETPFGGFTTSRLNVMNAKHPSNKNAVFQYQWPNNDAYFTVLDATTGTLWGYNEGLNFNTTLCNWNAWDAVGAPEPVITLPNTSAVRANPILNLDEQSYRLIVYYVGNSGLAYVSIVDLNTNTIVSTTNVTPSSNDPQFNSRERHLFYLAGSNIIYFDVDGLTSTVVAYPFSGFSNVQNSTYDFNTDSELWGLQDGGSGGVGNCVFRFLGQRLNPSPTSLDEVVSDLCTKVNLKTSDIDVTRLSGIDVIGYYVANVSTMRSILQQLMQIYYFDAVESDGVIKFVPRGSNSALTITQDDLSAHVDSNQLPDIVTITRAQDLDIPKTINVTYLDINNDYQTGTQYSRRSTKLVEKVQTNQYPVALDANGAKAVSETLLYDAWITRTTYEFVTTYKYSKVEPTDVITLSVNGANYLVRITQKKQEAGIITFQAVDEVPAIYSQSGAGAPSINPDNTILFPSPTRLFYLDIPTLRDVDNNPGVYLAASPANVNGTWKGALIMRSIDQGSSYQEAVSFFSSSTTGMSKTTLGNFTGGNVFDYKNSVTVMMIKGTLSSISKLQALNGMNLALLGNEIIIFMNATLVATNTYVLSGLIRGRFGTEQYISTHGAPETFVLLDATVRRYNETLQDINAERLYKAITFSNNLFSAPNQAFTDTGISLMPLSAVHLQGSRNASLDLTVTWIRRTRITGGWNDYIDVPLGETTEAYEVDILNGLDVVRTITSTTPTVDYTAAEQTTDFGSPQSSVSLNIYQMSASVGRGFPAGATL